MIPRWKFRQSPLLLSLVAIVVVLNDVTHSVERGLLLLLFIQFVDIIKIEFVFAFGAKMVQIFDDPLSDAFFMENVLARQQH